MDKENKPNNLQEEIIDQEELMAKYDREYSYRRFTNNWKKVITFIAIVWALFQLYTAAFGVFPSTLQRAPHVGFALMLTYLLYPFNRNDKSNRIPFYDYILAFLSVVVTSYHIIHYQRLMHSAGAYTSTDMYISIIAILLVLEATRRVVGPVIVALASFFLIYAYFGKLFPGFLAHRGYSIHRIATYGWLSTESILGIPTSVSATFIFLFLVFAAFLKKTKIGDWLTDLALGITGGATGGPAKAAVVASASQGTVTGSSVANTVGTGSITIPLMKSVGYRKEFAAAVEAAASTGGQLMPPIMGAAAFIMVEFTNFPYLTIAASAAIPALLYFTGIFVMVHLEATKSGLRGLDRSQLPDWIRLLKQKWFLALPIFGIVYFLVKGQTPMKAAFYGILMTIAVSYIRPDTRMSFRDILEALENGARSAIGVALACATAGIIVGIVTLSGLGIKFANGIIQISGGNLYVTMLFTMIASIILGMGVPTSANYIIQATVAAPALVTLGVPLIAAHLFVFYFGIIADITPPVALAAFAGSGIAGSNPFKTGFESFKIAFAAYIIPFIFATSPVLVLVNATFTTVLVAVITAIIGMIAIGGAISGFFVANCRAWERIVLFIAGLFLVHPEKISNLVGLILMILIYFIQRPRIPRHLKGRKKVKVTT
ncbi:C4-dicarboxylate TRAP transporter large permease protein DctM [Koleobacter methoxysyntrophicus]|uniref:C4-dicarboxylate TRAP transporter large permease protein DctM n=1 Tax=Koleobacter methoxysyntrophicus TaxID=2751313 RepID=A0A8A0RPC3_9FIRM|nr:TRAP transporter permease [Koleobacter methoxysyntrophicus]QSQ10245.1 C4-dicarboxylate TRAP transporter large permease protein DctM [Koleobacter methoxysyntrophicus]